MPVEGSDGGLTTRCSLQLLRRQCLQRGDFDQITLGQDQQLGLDQLAPLLDRCVVGCADLEAWMISSRDGRQAPRGSWLLRAAEQKSPSDPHEHHGLNLVVSLLHVAGCREPTALDWS